MKRRIGHKNDKKVAEHGICKVYRDKDGWDLYFTGQTLFDIEVAEGNKPGVTRFLDCCRKNTVTLNGLCSNQKSIAKFSN